MNGELIPAVVAATGGSALLAGIAAHEYRQEVRMRRGRQTFSVVFPAGATEAAAASALSSLAGLDYRCELVAEVAADSAGGIHHLLHVPGTVAGSVADQLGAALPGLRLDEALPRSSGPVAVAVRITAGQRTLLRSDDAAGGSRSLLSGLTHLADGERVSLRWALRPGVAAPLAAFDDREPTSLRERAERRALQSRQGEPGFGVHGLLLVRAASRQRTKTLAEHVLSVLRSRRTVGSGMLFRRGRVPSGTTVPQTGRRQGWLSAKELLPLLGWPLGGESIPGVEVGAARRLPVPRGVAREGRRLFTGRDAYGDRPVALSPEAGLHHLAVVGPSGVGKSVLLARGVLDQLQAGYGGVVIDPKGPDLVNLILERVAPEHVDRVVVLDPAAPGPVPGLDLLAGDADVRADVVVGALSAIFARAWGVRSDYYVRLAVRTLADVPGATLADLGPLLTDPGARRQALRHVHDPFTLAAWQAFEALPVAEQINHLQAPVARVMALLARPAVRAVIAATDPKLDVGRLLSERKFLLVSLSPGQLGEPATHLVGSLVMYALWTAIEARAALPAKRRHPVFVTVDELASVSSLPVSFELLAERSRGLGAGLTVATQTLGRLPESLRSSLLGNVASLVTFRAAATEAGRLAAELPGLTADDLVALRRFEVAARVGTGAGSSYVTVTGRTEPLPPVVGLDQKIRERSADTYGSEPRTDVVAPAPDYGDEAFGRIGRQR